MIRRSWMVATTCAAMVLAISVAVSSAQKGGGGEDAASLEGQGAPAWSLMPMEGGKKVSLKDMKGEVVFVDYWASWCPPCRASLPHVDAIAADTDLKAKGLKVYAINSKETKAIAEKYVKENNLKFNVLLDPNGEFGKAYKVRGIPTSVVVGRDGTVKKVFVGFGPGGEEKIKAAIEEALKEEAPAKSS